MKDKIIKEILDSTPSLYNQIASDFSSSRKKPWPINDLIKKHINSVYKIIDLGCGSGRLSELITDNQNYLGLDNSKELIKIAQNNYSTRKNIKFQVADIIGDNLPNQEFNLALMIAVLHHIPTNKLRLKILKNINKSLTNDGTLIITTWNLWQRKYRHHLFNYKLKIGKYKLLALNEALIPWQKTSYRYVHSFSKHELRSLLASAGFEVKEIFYEFQNKPTSILKGRNLVAVAKKIVI